MRDGDLVVPCVLNREIQGVTRTLIDLSVLCELCLLLFLLETSSAICRALTLRRAGLGLFGSNNRSSFDIGSEEGRFMLRWRAMLLETSLLKKLLVSQWSLFGHHEHCWGLFVSNNNRFTFRIVHYMMLSTVSTGLKFAVLSHMLALS